MEIEDLNKYLPEEHGSVYVHKVSNKYLKKAAKIARKMQKIAVKAGYANAEFSFTSKDCKMYNSDGNYSTDLTMFYVKDISGNTLVNFTLYGGNV